GRTVIRIISRPPGADIARPGRPRGAVQGAHHDAQRLAAGCRHPLARVPGRGQGGHVKGTAPGGAWRRGAARRARADQTSTEEAIDKTVPYEHLERLPSRARPFEGEATCTVLSEHSTSEAGFQLPINLMFVDAEGGAYACRSALSTGEAALGI